MKRPTPKNTAIFLTPLISLAVALLIILKPASPSVTYADEGFSKALVKAALERTEHTVRYDPAYVKLTYPGGDVPSGTGVCIDVIIRSYRALGIDLQKEIHEDMSANFNKYPKNWGAKRPDKNIDHRRVPNLQVFLERHGKKLKVTKNPADYRPGDIVTWMVDRKLPHVGIVVDKMTRLAKRPFIVHNIGRGPKLEDRLFEFPITGHYRYEGTRPKENIKEKNTEKQAERETGPTKKSEKL